MDIEGDGGQGTKGQNTEPLRYEEREERVFCRPTGRTPEEKTFALSDDRRRTVWIYEVSAKR